MKILKRYASVLLAAGAAICASAGAAYPDKPVTLVVPYPAGGATDVIARMIGEKLGQQWGQTVIINNRPGAGTTLAAEQLARSPGDGYTLYMTTAAHTISASLYRKLNYDPIKDFAPITLSSTIPLVLVTNPSLPVKDLKSLVAYAKASPQGLTYASTGNGTPQHLTGELFKSKTQTNLTHVPYRGDAPMITDLIGGQVQMAFVTLSAALPYIQSGKLKAIALASPVRVKAIGNVPTFAEAGMPGFEAATWFGLFGPASMPAALREQIAKDTEKVVAEPAMTQKLIEMGGVVNNLGPQQFQDFIQAEAKRWGEAVQLSGARID